MIGSNFKNAKECLDELKDAAIEANDIDATHTRPVMYDCVFNKISRELSQGAIYASNVQEWHDFAGRYINACRLKGTGEWSSDLLKSLFPSNDSNVFRSYYAPLGIDLARAGITTFDLSLSHNAVLKYATVIKHESDLTVSQSFDLAIRLVMSKLYGDWRATSRILQEPKLSWFRRILKDSDYHNNVVVDMKTELMLEQVTDTTIKPISKRNLHICMDDIMRTCVPPITFNDASKKDFIILPPCTVMLRALMMILQPCIPGVSFETRARFAYLISSVATELINHPLDMGDRGIPCYAMDKNIFNNAVECLNNHSKPKVIVIEDLKMDSSMVSELDLSSRELFNFDEDIDVDSGLWSDWHYILNS